MSEEVPPNRVPVKPGERLAPGYEWLEDDDQLLDRIKRHYDEGVGSFEENRRLHTEDLNFVYNSEALGQWDPVVLQARTGKPCYTFNRCIGPVNLVVADMRQTKPNGKVRPRAEGSSETVADILGGIMRSVEQCSRASTIYKTQYKFAVAGGFGHVRLGPVYASDNSFDQVLRIMDIPNPQTAICDPEANDPCAGDANWWVIADRISKDKHKALHPGFSDQSFSMSRDSYGWFTDKEVRVAEYYERIPFHKTIAQLDDGRVIDWTNEQKAVDEHLRKSGATEGLMVATRDVIKWRVMWCKVNGAAVLEKPIFYDWKRCPVARLPGRYINIEGRKKLQSLIRHAKDAQRSYNSRICDMIERSALTPKAPYLVTETMIKGYENEWATANIASRPFLPYNVDPKAEGSGGMPQRTPPIDVPTAALALAQAAMSDIQATIGYFDPALGNAEDMNRVSGKALVQHTRRSDLSSFEFIDGYGDFLQLVWDMGLDMIPTIYDTKRVERIIGQDGVEKLIQINHQTDDGDIINDLTEGEYDCTVTIGPSYQTARQEALATMIDASETLPSVGQLMPDLVLKNLDTPDVDEMVRRARIPLIQQGIVQPTDQEKAQMPPPQQPDPMKAAETARAQALAARDQASAVIENAKAQQVNMHTHEQIVKVAGMHLANLLAAQQLGQPDAAEQAEDSQGSQPTQA